MVRWQASVHLGGPALASTAGVKGAHSGGVGLMHGDSKTPLLLELMVLRTGKWHEAYMRLV
jgi:hypothetical protein